MKSPENKGYFALLIISHDEAIGLTHSPQTRRKPGLVRNQVSCSYNDFTTNENPWIKRHGTAGTPAVPFCYIGTELHENKRRFPVKGVRKIAAEEKGCGT